MNALEILLAESQERMAYEVRPENVDAVEQVAERYDLGCSVIGEVTDDGTYTCTFEGSEAQRASDEPSGDEPRGRETVVDADAEFLGDGAPMNDLESQEPTRPERDLPDADLREAFEAVVASPNTASKRWVYRQYDHEVQVRTATGPGDDAAVLALREAETGLAISSGANPNWTSVAPYDGARAVALENATNLAAKGATPLAAVDCLNGGNPEKPEVYGGFEGVVNGLADMCRELGAPVVGGNVSLYNDSPSGPIPPTPTLAMTGTKEGYEAPPAAVAGEGTLLVVGGAGTADGNRLGGSEYLAQMGGSDRFPALPENPRGVVEALAEVADHPETLAVHDVSHGGLAVALAEMVTDDAGLTAEVEGLEALFAETPGRAVVATADPEAVRERFDGVAPVAQLGEADDSGALDLVVRDETLTSDAAEIADLRDVLARELD